MEKTNYKRGGSTQTGPGGKIGKIVNFDIGGNIQMFQTGLDRRMFNIINIIQQFRLGV